VGESKFMAKRYNTEREEREDLRNYKKYEESLIDDSNIDWTDAKIEGVTIDGVPLDGNYTNNLLDSIDIER
jgi:hypothetical protein